MVTRPTPPGVFGGVGKPPLGVVSGLRKARAGTRMRLIEGNKQGTVRKHFENRRLKGEIMFICPTCPVDPLLLKETPDNLSS